MQNSVFLKPRQLAKIDNVYCSICDGNQTEFHSKKFKDSFISLSICPSPIRQGYVTPPPRLITTAEWVLTI